MKSAKAFHTLATPNSWSDMLWGELFRETLIQHLQPCISKIYGFYLLKIGNLSVEIDTRACTISHQIDVGEIGCSRHIVADPMYLPFEAKSVDACLLAHTLSWGLDPCRILKEVDRVLIDDGWIIITDFNLFSLLGLGKLFPGLHRCPPWNGRMFSRIRLLDWLSLLNYEVVFQRRFQMVPWKRQVEKMINIHTSALGCLNIMIARKRSLPLTLIADKKIVRKDRLLTTSNATYHLYVYV